MRIIAGELKGRKLTAPKDSRIRPTADKVREAVFSMLMHYVEDARVLDLFAGTGSLGIEALSRGASRCVFADHSRESIALVRHNLRLCGLEDRSEIRSGDFEAILSALTGQYDLIFLDPPYREGLLRRCLEIIRQRELLSPDGIIAAERGSREPAPDPEPFFRVLKEKKYGSIAVTLLTKQ